MGRLEDPVAFSVTNSARLGDTFSSMILDMAQMVLSSARAFYGGISVCARIELEESWDWMPRVREQGHACQGVLFRRRAVQPSTG
jgi:hypothetical protein